MRKSGRIDDEEILSNKSQGLSKQSPRLGSNPLIQSSKNNNEMDGQEIKYNEYK